MSHTHHPVVSVKVRIIADDLTGACDAAVPFAASGFATEAQPYWSLNLASSAPVFAINTETRASAAAVVQDRLSSLATTLRREPADYLIKKIDSVFRGNTMLEIATSLKIMPHDLAILAPAFPELGRSATGARLHVRDLHGEHSLDLAEMLRNAGVCARHIPLRTALGQNSSFRLSAEQRKLLLFDSSTQQDLEDIVRHVLARHELARILWIGSGGLTRALAKLLMPASNITAQPQARGRVVFVVGSDHPVSLGQLEHLHAQSGRAALSACFQVLPVERTMNTGDLKQQVEKASRAGLVTCFLVTGGDTATMLCHALGIRRLEVDREFARGVPVTRAVGGPWEGTSLILKSGGFGEQDLLLRVLEHFGNKESRHAG